MEFDEDRSVAAFSERKCFTVREKHIIAVIFDVMAKQQIEHVEMNLAEQIGNHLKDDSGPGVFYLHLHAVLRECNYNRCHRYTTLARSEGMLTRSKCTFLEVDGRES